MAVGGLEHFGRNDISVRIAEPVRVLARIEIFDGVIVEPGDLRLEQRQVDMLAHLGCVPVAQGGENTGRCMHAGHDVGDADAGFHGNARGLPGD